MKGVSYAYDGGRPALREVSLHVPAGTSLALVGASGSGKSTLARLVAGIGTPTGAASPSAAPRPPTPRPPGTW